MRHTESDPTFQLRGDAQIGFLHSSGRLAHLEVTREHLTLTVSMFGLFDMGRYAFAPADVVALKPATGFLGLGSGLRIGHTRLDYPEKIVFFAPSATVLTAIQAVGFTPNAPGAVSGTPADVRGFPFRWLPLVVVALIWNVLLGYEFFFSGNPFPIPGPLTLTSVLLLFFLSFGMLKSGALLSVFLKPGRQLGEIRPLLLLIALIAAFQALVLAILLSTGALQKFGKHVRPKAAAANANGVLSRS